MKSQNKTLVMSDGHYATQYKTISNEVHNRYGRVGNVFNVGDLTAQFYDKADLDPSYKAKLAAIADGKNAKEASAAQEQAWETDLEGMLETVFNISLGTKYSMQDVQEAYKEGKIPKVKDTGGNVDGIFKEQYIQKAADMLGIDIKSNKDYISETEAVEQLGDVYTEVKGNVRYITIPFTDNDSEERSYQNKVDQIINSDEEDISKVIILTHENAVPEAVGVKRPVAMKNLKQMIESVAGKYLLKGVETVVISGHIHAFPEEGNYVEVDGVKYYPIGIDKTGGVRYLIIDDDGEIVSYDTRVNLSESEIKKLKQQRREEGNLDELLEDYQTEKEAEEQEGEEQEGEEQEEGEQDEGDSEED